MFAAAALRVGHRAPGLLGGSGEQAAAGAGRAGSTSALPGLHRIYRFCESLVFHVIIDISTYRSGEKHKNKCI